mgnify:CR=1 FL=1
MFYRSNKVISVSVVIFLIVTLIPSFGVGFTNNQVLDKYKEWKITCNQEILESSAKEAIKVLDQNNNIVQGINVGLDNDKKIIIVSSPDEGYIKGSSYKLLIDTNLKSINNKFIEESIELNFSISNKENTSNISDRLSPVSILSESDIIEIGANGFEGTDKEIAEDIRNWQVNNVNFSTLIKKQD